MAHTAPIREEVTRAHTMPIRAIAPAALRALTVRPSGRRSAPPAAWALGCALGLASLTAVAQGVPSHPVTAGQRSTAQQVAQAGVPLSELAANAPERHTVQRGDTLWAISALFLQRPWRWPELWGMNLQQIRNPHLIYPGQVLVLTRVGDRAILSLDTSAPATVRLSPRVRAEAVDNGAIAPIPLHVIEPFLTDSLVVDAGALERAPRIVATPESRVLLSRGDRAYARGQYGPSEALDGDALTLGSHQPHRHRVFRNATPILDPDTQEVIGHEAQFIGQTELLKPETLLPGTPGSLQPASVQITLSKEEIRIGDRLLPEPAREVPTYLPRPPATAQDGRIAKVHGNAVQYAGQNQIVILNRGARDGLERGHVLAVLKDAASVTDSTDDARPSLQLPGERNGLMIVFRTFDRVSYALVLQITDGVKVGDRFVNP